MVNTDAMLAALPAGAAFFIAACFAFRFQLAAPRKALLYSFSSGVLLYLLCRAASYASGELGTLLLNAVWGYPAWGDFIFRSAAVVLGWSAGLFSLFFMEKHLLPQDREAIFPPEEGHKVSQRAAYCAGTFHLFQGLAVGALWGWGEHGLAVLMGLGFGLYNASSGYSAASPLSGHFPGLAHAATLGASGMLPALIGAMAAGWQMPKIAELFLIALACGGALAGLRLILQAKQLLKPAEEKFMAFGLLGGFLLGFLFEMIVLSQTVI